MAVKELSAESRQEIFEILRRALEDEGFEQVVVEPALVKHTIKKCVPDPDGTSVWVKIEKEGAP